MAIGTSEPKSEKPSFNTKIVNVKVVKEKVTKALESTATVEFKDVSKTNWSASAIELAAKIGFVRGYADGSFKSDAKVTRAEFATMLVKALGIESKGDSSFADTKGNWAADAINALKSNGIINGYADGTFKPNNQISRAETVTILSKVMNMSNSSGTSKSFKDISGSWAEDAINKLSAAGIVGGKGEGKFDPNSTTSRAESVTMILRVLNVSIDLGIKL